MNRRKFVKLAGGTGVIAGLAGCSAPWGRGPGVEQTPSPDPTPTPERPGTERPQPPHAEEYGTVVNMAALGADRTGGDDILDLLESHAGDDTLIYFPEGRYLLADTLHLREFENFGMVGDRAVIVPERGDDGVLFDLGRPDQATDCLVEGLTFDFQAPKTGPRPLSLLAAGNVVVRDLSVVGLQDVGWGMLRIDITDRDSVGLVERLHLPDGSAADTVSTGCLVGDDHRGEIHFVDCHIAGFADNGLYADPRQGSVRVTGGYFANSATSSLRVGDNSIVRGAHIRCDRAPEGFGNMRGLRLRHGNNILVENCSIDIQKVTGSDGAIVLEDELEAATIRNTTIQVNADGIEAIRVKSPDSAIDDSGACVFDGIIISGTAGKGPTIQVADRLGCEFRNIYVRQEGENRDGFDFNDSRAIIDGAYIDVTGRPFVTDSNSDIRQTSVNFPTSTNGELFGVNRGL